MSYSENYFRYIRDEYGVPAKKGGRVKYNGRPGTIVSVTGSHLRILLDGETKPGTYHPTWRMEYEK